MSQKEVTTVEVESRKKGATPMGILEKINKDRKKKKLPLRSESAVRRVLRWKAYQRAKVEHRKQKRKATKKLIEASERPRAKISKKNKGKRATYKMIMTDAETKGVPSARYTGGGPRLVVAGRNRAYAYAAHRGAVLLEPKRDAFCLTRPRGFPRLRRRSRPLGSGTIPVGSGGGAGGGHFSLHLTQLKSPK